VITFDQANHPHSSIFCENEGAGSDIIAPSVCPVTAYPETTLNRMKLENSVMHHLLNIVAHAPGIRIEHLAQLTPELTLKEVLYTLCYLSRKGQLRLIVNGQGGFSVTTTLRFFN